MDKKKSFSLRNFLVFSGAAFFCFLPLSCGKVTYPKSGFEKSLADVLLKECDLQAKVKIEGRTLEIALHFKKLWSDAGFVEEKTWETLNRVIVSTRRVVFSSDVTLHFIEFIINADDSKEELRYIHAMSDVKLFYYEGISLSEYSKRQVLVRRNRGGEEPLFKEVTWGDFLAGQIGQRVKEKYRQESLSLPEKDQIKNIVGVFIPKDNPNNQLKQDLLVLVIQSKNDPPSMDSLIKMTRETIQETVKLYHGSPFEHVRVLNFDTQTIFEVP